MTQIVGLYYNLLILLHSIGGDYLEFKSVSIIEFLQKYRYLKMHSNGNLLIDRDESIKMGITLLQKTYGIPPTGILDNDRTKKQLLLSPRCGNSDYSQQHHRFKRYVINEQTKWPITNITYKINSFPTSGLSRRKVHKIFQIAFNLWSQDSTLDFTEIFDSSKDAHIIIEFAKRRHGDYIPFDGPGNVLAHAYLPDRDDSGYTRNGDAHFDDDEPWTDDNTERGKSLLAVAVHEIGHSLGLGHSLNETSVMFPYYQAANTGIFLFSGDISAIQNLYGKPHHNKSLTVWRNFPDDHVTHNPEIRITSTKSPPGVPDPCHTHIDAVMIVRRSELFAFSGRYCWRVGWSLLINGWRSYQLIDQPTLYGNIWKIMEDIGIINGIDAAVEEPYHQQFYIFKGKRFWILESFTKLRENFPAKGELISLLGLPTTLEKIDSIFIWGYNDAAYILSGKLYWKFHFGQGTYGRVYASPSYPRNMKSVWIGVPNNVDAVFSDLNKNTYFIKNKLLYLFNDIEMTVQQGYPKRLKLGWLGCP